MKTALLSLATGLVLFSSTASFAAPVPDHRDDDKRRKGYTKYNDRNDRDFNYGYDKKHRVTPAEKARWEATQRNERRDDYRDNRRDNDNRREDRNDRNFNYGYEKNHRVTPQERARWEAAHRNDHR
ncbi:hypothetical protein [Hymenobacter glacieicola]|uniref:Uncharacterized protein n=1 Tax=Hymenobacter glacieicola TaxID=1562124 RepID=A0ABQ1WXA7_9BACT|nr:hypothetical protein [Hymenobacter glacieicola]GGG49534.1 hypothetical protein GCM10011378_27070 [Hymenobacter glacieicola]